MKRLATTSEVVDELGGVPAVATLTKRKPNAVYNWVLRGRFASNTYVVLTRALEQKRLKAPDNLWRMVPPSKNGKLHP